MRIAGSTALVTGAGRGLGRHFAQALLERGASRVYATARRADNVDVPRATPLALDVTDPASIAAAASLATDVDLVVNNAGLSRFTRLLTDSDEDLRDEWETNALGPIRVARAFAPVLAAHGGGAVLNVLSVLAWVANPMAAGYAASKSAAWSMTNALRLDLAEQGTLVTALLMAATDTDMMAGIDVPKNSPKAVVGAALDGVEAGEFEILGDSDTVGVKAALAGDLRVLYPGLAVPTSTRGV